MISFQFYYPSSLFPTSQDQALLDNNHARLYGVFPSLKTFVRDNQYPFYKENLMVHLFEINGSDVKTSMVSSTYVKLKPLEIICLPRTEMKMEVTHTGVIITEKNRWGQTNRSYSKGPMLVLSCKIFKTQMMIWKR